MARILSLADSQPQASADQSRASSVTITRLYCYRSLREDFEDPATGLVELGVKSASTMLPLAGGSNSSVGHSYWRHGTYFFEDGNITFSVREALRYCIRPVQK